MFLNNLISAPSMNDLYLAVGAVLFLSFILFLSEILKKYFQWTEENTRKIVHVSVGLAAAFAPFYFSSPLLLFIFAASFGLVDFFAVRYGLFKGIHGNRFSYGTVYFPIAYFILLFAFWNVNKSLILIGIIFFAIPDAIAAIVGQKIKNPHNFIVITDKKSVEGSIAHFITSFILLFLIFNVLDFNFAISNSLFYIALIISFVVTTVETMSSKGSDNLFVPISGSLLTYIFLIATYDQTIQIFIGLVLAFMIITLSYFFKFLSFSGFAMTFLLATSIFGLGGIKWTVPILLFFLLSSILSKTGEGY